MISQLLWEKGTILEEYVNQMSVFQKQMQQRINNIYITSAEFERFKNIEKPTKILVLTDEKCKDTLMNLPIIAKIAEASPIIDMKIFDRDQFPSLAEFFREQGYVNVPICWMMEDDFSLIGVWVERPKKAYKMLENWRSENPEVEEIKEDTTLSPEEKEEKLKPYMDRLVDEMWNWYDTDLQSETVKEIYEIIKN